jgi:hypothetical protein
MATAFPTLAYISRVDKETILPEVQVYTSRSGKEVRTGVSQGSRYRYKILVAALTTSERAALLSFVGTIGGRLGLVTYTDPDTGGSVTCRLDSDISYTMLCSGWWIPNSPIELVTVL